MKYAAAVDIGRVKVQVALFDESYNIVDHQSFDSCIDDPNKTLDEIASRVLKFPKTICGIGISCPGILDAMKGTLLYTPNLGDKWCGLHVTEALSKRTGLPVYLENNANLAGLAEAVIGKGKDCKVIQFLRLSTNVGAGLIIDKKIFKGAHGFANEFSPIRITSSSGKESDKIGNHISETGILDKAKKAGLTAETVKEVDDLAKAGNEKAVLIVKEAKEHLANLINAIIAFADPDMVVLGGSVPFEIEGFTEEIEEMVKSQIPEVVCPMVRICRSGLNENSNLIGACNLAFSKEVYGSR